tara:strand:- start:834 stop:1070 length:237 start_codon:yes stop_codon:yes gene_type:complete
LLENKIANQLHQFGLLARHNKACGFLIEFREAGEFRWFNLTLIKETLKTRKSLVRQSGILIGHTFPTEINLDLVLENP